MSTPLPESRTVTTRWPERAAVPVRANQVSTSLGGSPIEEFVLTFGYAAQPLLSGTADEQRTSALELTEVPVDIVARISVAPSVIPILLDACTKAAALAGLLPAPAPGEPAEEGK